MIDGGLLLNGKKVITPDRTQVDVSDLEALPDEIALNALEEGTIFHGDETVKASDQRRLKNRVEDSKASRLEERRSFVDRLAEGDV